MKKKFAEHKGLNLTTTNKEVLAQWIKDDIFHKSISQREGCPRFVFYEGPPSANGHPGIHHVLARTIKDIFNRYKTMQGYQVPRKAGWDTHGLPVELTVESELGITKKDIDNKASDHYISVKDYNLKCRENVMKYTTEWRELTERMGYFVDLDNPYITCDNKYIETLWWLIKRLYDNGLLYKGYTIQPYSPAAGTGLSSHELNLPGCYRDVKDTMTTALFEIIDTEKVRVSSLWGKLCFAAWTTTPWTLPSNTALCVGPAIDYVALQTYNPYNDEPVTIIMARARVGAYLQAEGEVLTNEELQTRYQAIVNAVKAGDKKGMKAAIPYRVVGSFTGEELVGVRYKQLMPWVKPCEKIGRHAPAFVMTYAERHPEKVFTDESGKDSFVEMSDEAFRVIDGDFVTTDDGTGIVHVAPTFGADDAKVAKDSNLPALYLINKRGETRPMVDLQGKYYDVAELDNNFIAHCVDQQKYSVHAGDYVKNAYDPKYNVGGVWDVSRSEREPDLNVVIAKEMRQAGTAYKIEKGIHNYPHCWRTDKPILYYPLDSWFIRDTARKERMVELNKTINWHPATTGTGRFAGWLENLNDWNLSRSRFWGTPLPIWRNDDGEEKCIGSLRELYDEIEEAVAKGVMTTNPLKANGFVPGDYTKGNYDRIDLHRPDVDDITLISPTGKPLRRETDLIDVWFDSGAMPYAQVHYPFENKDVIDAGVAFPADFINEGVDQTRGWFFTLHAISTMVFDSVAFKNVISSGLVLDAKGLKMSKHLGNTINPFEMIDKYGADAVRFYMISNSEPWDDLKFDPNGVEEVQRKFFGTLYNTYSFFAQYANVDDFDPAAPIVAAEARPEIDRWILSSLNTLISNVTRELDNYDPTRALRLIDNFVLDDLSNWYVRLNRKRFWGKDMSTDKLCAYQTLYTCLLSVVKMLAPFAPFISDEMYNDLTRWTHEDNNTRAPQSYNITSHQSVHLAAFPQTDATLIDNELERRMVLAQRITSMVLALRRKVNIKVKQPLRRILIPAVDSKQKHQIETVSNLICGEVNVKELRFADGNGLLVRRVKCNFRVMGKKYGRLMKELAMTLGSMSQTDITRLERDGHITISVAGNPLTIDAADVEIISEDIPGWLVANDGNLTVALDITINEELRLEGIARELVNRIQNIRKASGLEITDRIDVTVTPNEQTDASIGRYGDYIRSQVLANTIAIAPNDGVEVELNDSKLNIQIIKI